MNSTTINTVVATVIGGVLVFLITRKINGDPMPWEASAVAAAESESETYA